MSINCSIVRNPLNNNVERVEAPNGEESILYKSALKKFNDAKTALNVWAVSSLTSFKEQVRKPSFLKEEDTESVKKQTLAEFRDENYDRIYEITDGSKKKINLAIENEAINKGIQVQPTLLSNSIDGYNTKMVDITELEKFVGEDRLGKDKMKSSRGIIDNLKKSISLEGLKEPLIMFHNDLEASIVEGNHRYVALKELGFKFVPVSLNKNTIPANVRTEFLDVYPTSLTPTATELGFRAFDLSKFERFEKEQKKTEIKYTRQGNLVVLEEIKTIPDFRGRGLARKALQDFLVSTDEVGATVKLIVSPRDNSTDETKLQEFYMSEGFNFDTENGIPSSFEMVRYPDVQRKRFDKNGEPLLKTVLDFIESNKEAEPLSQKDIFDIEDMIVSEGLTDSSDILKELDLIFKNGDLNIIYLQNSKMFSGSEVSNIVENKEYQKELMGLRDKLRNLDSPIVVSYFIEKPFIIMTGEVNKFGKNAIVNPLEVQEDLNQFLGGVKDIESFTDAVNNLDYAEIIEQYNTSEDFKSKLFSQFSGLSKMQILNRDISNVEAPNRLTAVTETLNLDGSNFTEDVKLLNQAEDFWDDSRLEIIDGLSEIEEKGIEASLDLEGLAESYDSKDSEEILTFLNSLSTLEQNVTQENFDMFLEEYKQFFNIETAPMFNFEKMAVAHKGKTLIKIEDSSLNEYDMFNEQSMVKVAPGIYQKVQKVSFEDMLEVTYAEASSRDNRILPNQAYFINSNSANNAYLRDEANKQTVIDNIRLFVEDNVGSMDLGKEQYDFDVAYNLYLYKQVFENPITVKVEGLTQEEQKSVEDFKGDSNFLTDGFISEFQKKKLKEKRLDSEKFKEVYNYFEINSLGILPKYQNNATKNRVKEAAQRLLTEKEFQDLSDYFRLNKNSSFFEESYSPTYVPSLQAEKLAYQNDPTKLAAYKGDYQRVKDVGVTTFATSESFIRINSRLYQKTSETQGQPFYTQIPVFNSEFFVVEDTGEVNKFEYNTVKNYLRRQPNIESKSNKYSSTELENINENNFDCN